MAAPELARGIKLLQLASGVGVSPTRTLSARLVPDGTSADHAASNQPTGAPASRTRDKKLPEATYGGVSHIQSTVSAAPPTLASLTTGRRLAVMAIGCEATCVPS